MQRPIILNGIEEFVVRSDLMDRSLILHIPNIPDHKRVEEGQFWGEFEKAKPRLLGALYDTVSAALAILPTLHPRGLPRMADFAKWGMAIERALGWEDGTFVEAYQNNREAANEIILEASNLYDVFCKFTRQHSTWALPAGMLLQEIKRLVPKEKQFEKGFPRTPKGLRDILTRLAPNLRTAGIHVRFDTTKAHQGHRWIHISSMADGGGGDGTCPAQEESDGFYVPRGEGIDEPVAIDTEDLPEGVTCDTLNYVLQILSQSRGTMSIQQIAHRLGRDGEFAQVVMDYLEAIGKVHKEGLWQEYAPGGE